MGRDGDSGLDRNGERGVSSIESGVDRDGEKGVSSIDSRVGRDGESIEWRLE